MITYLSQMVDKWTTTQQFFMLFLSSSMVTLIILALIQTISVFFNDTIPILFRGYPPEDNNTDDE